MDSSSLPSFSTSPFPSSSSNHPGSCFPPMVTSSSQSSSYKIGPLMIAAGGACEAKIPFTLGCSLGPIKDGLLRFRREVSRGGKGGMTRPPGVDGCSSGSFCRLDMRGWEGEEGDSTPIDWGVGANCVDKANGVKGERELLTREGDSKSDSDGGLPSSIGLSSAWGGEGVGEEAVKGSSIGADMEGSILSRRGGPWERKVETVEIRALFRWCRSVGQSQLSIVINPSSDST